MATPTALERLIESARGSQNLTPELIAEARAEQALLVETLQRFAGESHIFRIGDLARARKLLSRFPVPAEKG